MTEWKFGDRGRIGDTEFEVTYDWKSETVNVKWNLPAATNTISRNVLAAMGAVRIPPTIGTPQSVRDNPPPDNELVLIWHGRYWGSILAGDIRTSEWWMPMPAPPPGVTQ